MSGRLHSGEVEIELDGERVALAPTLNAAKRIAQHFGGFQPALNRLQAWDLDAYVAVVRHALGYRTEAEARGLDERVYRSGMMKLMVPLTEYLMVLANGGRGFGTDEAASEPGEAVTGPVAGNA